MSSLSRLLYRSFCTTTLPAPEASTPSMRSIVDKLFKERNLTRLVKQFKQSSEIYRFRTKHRVYQTTVRRLASAKRFTAIEEILEDQKRYHDITKEGFAVRLISLYGNAGMAEHASKTFEQLPDLNCERTVKSFNALLHAYVESGSYDKVEGIFREFPEKFGVMPDEFSYTIVIQALCSMGSLDSAVEMLDEMEKKGLEANVVTFNTLLYGFYDGNRFLDGERIWARMEKKDVVPDIRSYNARLRGLVCAGKRPEAAKFLEELKGKDIKPNTFTYDVLIKSYCKDGKLEEAKKVYEELLANECVENRSTFEALIPTLCENGDIDFALKLCTKSLGLRRFVDANLLQLVVDGLVKQSNVDGAKELVALARSKSYSSKKVDIKAEEE